MTYLIVTSAAEGTKETWLIIDRQGEMTEMALPVDPDSEGLLFAGTSPSQRQFAFFVLGDNGFSLWVSTIDGRKRERLLSDIAITPSLVWVNDDIVVVLDRPTGQIWPATFARVTLSTGKVVRLPSVYLDFGLYAFSPDGTQLIYLDPYSSWRLYDFESGANVETKLGPEAARIALPFFGALQWAPQGVAVAVLDERQLTLALDVEPRPEKNTPPPTRQYQFRQASELWNINWVASDGKMLAISRSGVRPAEYDFHVLDLAREELLDYCLPAELLPGNLRISFDQNVIAWTVNEAGPETGVVVLNLLDGKRAWLSGVRLKDWAQQP